MEYEVSEGREQPLRVLLIGNYEPDRQQSMQRYARDLATWLMRAGVQVTLIAPNVFFGRLAFQNPSLIKWLGYLDKYVTFLPRLLAAKRCFDIIHITDHANAVYRRAFAREAVVITCHDLFAVRGMLGVLSEHRPRSSGRQLQRMILNSLRTCPAIVCVSDATAKDVRKLVAPDLLDVIPNGIQDDYGKLNASHVDVALATAGVDKPYFLHVGGNQFYKNRPGVVRVFDELAALPAYRGHHLVLAGKQPDEDLRAAIAAAQHRERITVLAAPDDTTVQALYSRAEALLFLSLTEGFGWPIIEAQACGCLVVTTDREPMSHIAGSAAILVDPNDLSEAVRRIAHGLTDAKERRAEGLRNAAQYRGDQVYAKYIQFYERAILQARSSRPLSPP